MECWTPPKLIYILHKLTPKIQFYRNCRINHVFEMFENQFEIENLKKGSLRIENFEMKWKFENFESGFWKLDFEIKNLSFINLRLGNL